jgi:iron complex outermembrane receptor protein
MKRAFHLFTVLLPIIGLQLAKGQSVKEGLITAIDSSRKLHPVVISGYLSPLPMLSVPASVGVLTPAQLALQPSNSLVSSMNTVPGVRMEERSPGSYRLSIRGSLLRAPYGVRDVKVYFDEIPLTNAGGDTYVNALDFSSVKNIEVLKGPDGSLFGANSGGVVIINPAGNNIDSAKLSAGLNAGSYGLAHENANYEQKLNNAEVSVNQAYETFDGYRSHSYMRRHYIQTVDGWHYSDKDELKALAFYSDLFYQTPGGLTYSQMLADPQSARLPTAKLPGAIQQNIAITTQMLLGGLVNEFHFNSRLRNVLSVFGNHVYFTNPFITNYEIRNEDTYGLRTYFELTSNPETKTTWRLNLGLEWQNTSSAINNYGNRGGIKDTAQALDHINTTDHFFFSRYAVDLMKKLHVEGALSLNYYQYHFKNIYPLRQTDFTPRDFTPQLMPRLALSYSVTGNFIWRASVSRGYSPPTTDEVRPSSDIVNTSLQAQTGWNYETGFRLRNVDESMLLDASMFYYRVQNAIVMRLNPNDTQYYLNAGGLKQPGLELYFTDWLFRNQHGFIRALQFNESVTLSHFSFVDYHDATNNHNYSGNRLSGVPNQVFVSSVQIKIPQSVYLFVQHNYTSSIPLNDANTVFANHYHLVQAKAGWQKRIRRRTTIELYAGADNILNQHYSLGNDLNATGNRFYNPAPLRNYFAGFNVNL